MLNSNLLPASWRLLRYLNLGRVGQVPSGRVCYSLGISLCWAFGFLSGKVAVVGPCKLLGAIIECVGG